MKYILLIFFLFSPGIFFAQSLSLQPFEACDVEGSITLYHLEKESWYFSDETDANRETLPASTFKILNSAIALETGAVADEHEIIEWDGTENTFFGTPIAAWNQDINMERAFSASAIWFYAELARRIGKDEYSQWLHSVQYGNGNLDQAGHDFWNFGHFGITPVNHIQFLVDWHQGTLPFSEKTYQTVTNLMVSETTADYTIFGKTGWTKTSSNDIGWWVGYVVHKHGTWFFATRITKDVHEENPEFSACRMEITKHILKEKGII